MISSANVSFHSYSDDTQLNISVEPSDEDALSSLTGCLSTIIPCMDNLNLLNLNEHRVEIL